MVNMSLSFAALAVALLSANVAVAAPYKKSVDIQAHRGGLGYRPESTLYAFSNAIEIGVQVLEMDTVFTKDGIPVIWHDHSISPLKCSDTTGKFVGKFIKDLTLAEVKTLDCGSKQLADHPQQKLFPGAKIQTLEEILLLVKCVGDRTISINLETKIDPVTPNETWPVAKYLDLIPILRKHNFETRTTIQSFDWRTLVEIHKAYPEMQLVALADNTTIWPSDFRAPNVTGYPWLGGIDLSDPKFGGDWVKAATSFGASVISPDFHSAGVTVESPTYKPFLTKEMVERAKKLGMKTVPWTIDDEASIRDAIVKGVDAVISNYPERVRAVAERMKVAAGKEGFPVPDRCLVGGGSKVLGKTGSALGN